MLDQIVVYEYLMNVINKNVDNYTSITSVVGAVLSVAELVSDLKIL